MAFLVDTNILLRTIVPSDPMHAEAVDAVSRLIAAGEELFALPQNIAEFWNACTRPTGKNGLGYAPKKADVDIEKITGFVTVIPEHIDTYLEWRRLVVLHNVRGVKTHDARLAAAMIAQGLVNILTFNDKDFKRFTPIKAYTPADVNANY